MRWWLAGIFVLWAGVCHAEYRFTIRPVLSVSTEYTDNIFLSDKDREADLIKVISPGIEAGLASRTSQIHLGYNIGYSRYSRFPEYDSWRHGANLDGKIGLSRHTWMEFAGSAQITEEPEEEPSDLATEPVTGETSTEVSADRETIRRTRQRYLSGLSRMSLTHQFGPNDLFILVYGLNILRNENPEIRNELRHSPSAEVVYWPVPGKFQVRSRVHYLRNDIRSAIGDPGYLDEQIDPSVDLLWQVIPSRFSIRSGLAYSRGVSSDETVLAEGEDPEDNWHESLKPSAGLTYIFREHHLVLDADAWYDRAITWDNYGLSDPSDDFDEIYGKIRLTRQFTNRLDLFAQYAHTVRRYGGPDADGNLDDYDLYAPTVGIKYVVADKLPLSLDLGYVIRDKADGKESAFTVNGSVGRWRFCKDGTVRFQASSGYNNDDFGTEKLGFGFYYNAGIMADYVFSKDLIGDAGLHYERNQYTDNETSTRNSGDARDDTTLNFDAGLTYRPAKWISVRLGYRYRDVNATGDGDSYTDNRVSFQVDMVPARPLHLQ